MSQSPAKITRPCEHCGTPFTARADRVRRGEGRFCSVACTNAGRRRSLKDRFFDGVGGITPAGCILWKRSVRNGRWHGQISEGGHGGKMLVASRVAYELFVGPIPDGLSVLHQCDNPACVNPAHLFLGTQADNMADMWGKGRGASGERQWMSKLTADGVREIRRRAAAGEPLNSIARDFHVTLSNVSLIVSRKRWARVT